MIRSAIAIKLQTNRLLILLGLAAALSIAPAHGQVIGTEIPALADTTLTRIADEPGGGLIVYMAGHEGRGIGLWAKAATYVLQDAGEDTYQANRSLGLPDDSRDFSDAAALLRYFLDDKPFRLLTNNPKKVADLNNFGVRNITPVKHVIGVTERNREYLKAKRDWGHELDLDELEKRDLQER